MMASGTRQTARDAGETTGFANALLDPDQPMPDNLTGPTGHADQKRFSVYRNNVVVSLLEALQDNFPAIFNLLGEENFRLVARNYVAAHPPRTPMMQNYGDDFAEFVSGFPPLGEYPFLADLARAECAWIEAFHAPDEPVLTGEVLQQVDGEELAKARINMRAATFVIVSPHPVADLFGARQEPVSPDFGEAQNLVITRPAYQVEARQIDDAQAVFLTRLIDGTTLGEAIGAALETGDGVEAPNLLALLLQSGAAAGLAIPQS